MNGWKPETLATIAGILRRDYGRESTYEIVATVWAMAATEGPAIGEDRLLDLVRRKLDSFAERTPESISAG